MDAIGRVNLERQANLGLELPEAVAVVGCGGVGSWVALQLALAGVRFLWLWDGDTVSDHNLNRLPVPPESIERPKSQALAEMIRMLRPECHPLAMGKFIPELGDDMSMAETVTWVVCSTDSAASRKMVYSWCIDHSISYVEASAEGEMGGCTGAPADWETEEEQLPGYASVPVWVGPCVMAAATACYHVLHNQPMGDTNVRLGWDVENSNFTAELHEES